MPYADCIYCGEPIADAADAVVARETPPDEDDPGTVAYRHPECSAADGGRDRSTSIEM